MLKSGFLPRCVVPLLVLVLTPGDTAANPQATGSVSGVVMDGTGAPVAGAEVSLVPAQGEPSQMVTSGAQGAFTFTAVAEGSYRVKVVVAGFTSVTTKAFTITAQQVYVVPEISLVLSPLAEDVTVRPTQVIAAEQIEVATKQRLVGGWPNFYVSYAPDAAPLTSRQKLSLAARYTFDWAQLGGVSVRAGMEHAANAHAGYGQGFAGYGKRWAALLAGDVSRDLLSHYVFASAFEQDPRYFYKGTGTKKGRLLHAVRSAVVARSDSGRPMPNYAYLLGDVSSAALSTAYYPREERSMNRVLTSAALGVALRAGLNVMREFVVKRPSDSQEAESHPSRH